MMQYISGLKTAPTLIAMIVCLLAGCSNQEADKNVSEPSTNVVAETPVNTPPPTN